MAACDAGILIVSAVHGATTFGFVESFDWREEVDTVEIPGEGTTFVACVATRLRRYMASLTFMIKGAATYGVVASLVITQKDADGDTITDTLALMKALGVGKSGNRASPPFMYTQNFQHEGAAFPIS